MVFDLLVHFAHHPDRVFSRDELIDAVWAGRVVSDATVASCIKQARRALGDSATTRPTSRRCVAAASALPRTSPNPTMPRRDGLRPPLPRSPLLRPPAVTTPLCSFFRCVRLPTCPSLFGSPMRSPASWAPSSRVYHCCAWAPGADITSTVR
ncbi:winged helix-turn-helix domain-containing protein [Halomonas jincaotanensis]|uniref:winged helix-turn-helix domain-containing protein n=1 Tax=Halomonas jincaotanensis TaxID=2810616 RepID=UPI003872DC72